MCLAQGLPAESNLDGAELIFKPLKPRFFWLCGAAQPQAGGAAVAAELLALPQFPCVQSQELQALGWSQRLLPDPPALKTCEVTPPWVRV